MRTANIYQLIAACTLTLPAAGALAGYTVINPSRTLTADVYLEDVTTKEELYRSDSRSDPSTKPFSDGLTLQVNGENGTCRAAASQTSEFTPTSITVECIAEATLLQDIVLSSAFSNAESRFETQLQVDSPTTVTINASITAVDFAGSWLTIWEIVAPGVSETLVNARDFGAKDPDVSLSTTVNLFPDRFYFIRFYSTAGVDGGLFSFGPVGGANSTLALTFAPACLADLDADGATNAADLALLLAAWGGPDADLNNDGITNAADLAVLLAAWGPCP